MKYRIIQLKDVAGCGYAFMNYNYAKTHGFGFDDYKVVYEGECPDGDDIETLEHLFYKFNIQHPTDFKGHSLSVSDIVELDGLAYYCDSTAWVAL